MKVIHCRNVNDALDRLRSSISHTVVADGDGKWVKRPSRNGPVIEIDRPVATVYSHPWERVSFSRARDANPFFHLFESLWILAGRSDVQFLSMFNKRMGEYSDDGVYFHAPYGKRLRRHFTDAVSLATIDQLKGVASILIDDPNSRRAVMSIWDPGMDLGANSKDIPCNDLIMFKARATGLSSPEYQLDMTVCCRSNDAIWGAYGANVVQFSTIQELLATELNMAIGDYTQISDSFHVYTDNDAWRRMMQGHDWRACKYISNEVRSFALCSSPMDEYLDFCENFCNFIVNNEPVVYAKYQDPFFMQVALQMWSAWRMYRFDGRLDRAIEYLETQDLTIDWLQAGMQWLIRRVTK